MILVVVYVGAVLVLFLFVVMMLDVDFAVLRAGFLKYLPVGATIGILLLVELILILGGLGDGAGDRRASAHAAGLANEQHHGARRRSSTPNTSICSEAPV